MKRTLDHAFQNTSTVDLSVDVEEFAPMNEEERHVKVLKRDTKNRNHQYECKYCHHTFNGGASKIKAHFCDGLWSTVRVAPCMATKPSATEKWILELKLKKAKDKESSNQKLSSGQAPAAVGSPSQRTISGCFENMQSSNVEMAVLAFLADNNIAPNVLDSPFFKNMLNACCAFGASTRQVTVSLPGRKQFGINGTVLDKGLELVETQRTGMLHGLKTFGNTLCSDGAKNNKRSALNTVLVSVGGTLFVQSTDATIVPKKNARYLLDDIGQAVDKVGIENVFLVCMDGACKGTLTLIDQTYQQIFPQRCATHGYSLLHKDVAQFFGKGDLETIKWAMRALKLFVNHTYLYGELLACGGRALQVPVDTRFASLVLCCELLLKDRTYANEIINKASIQEWKNSQSADVKREFDVLRRKVWNCDSFWDELKVFVAVETPIRIALRITDTETPNLPLAAKAFDDAQAESLKLASVHENDEAAKVPLNQRVLGGLKEFIKERFEARRPDCVSKMAMAAAMIVPHYCYGTPTYVPEGGPAAIAEVIEKYFGTKSISESDIAIANHRITEAKKEYFAFRNHLPSTEFGSPLKKREATCYVDQNGKVSDPGGVLQFWQGCSHIAPLFAELAIKLSSAVCGQGSAERLNKDVTLVRSKTRNRQSHEVTAAYLTLKNYFGLQNRRSSTATSAKLIIDFL